MTQINTNTQVQKAQENGVSYMVAGRKITLNYAIVKQYLVKGGGNVTDAEIALFMELCKTNALNPFVGEAFLIKYAGSPAQMTTAYDALRKRAENNPHYDGIEYGVIIERDGQTVEIEGAFVGENEKLLGAWAKVYRKDRTRPTVARVSFSEYNKGQALWKEKPATMIAKVAKATAMREAFPTSVAGMYLEEEYGKQGFAAEEADVIETRRNEQGKQAAVSEDAKAEMDEFAAGEQTETLFGN